ncbi:MAG: hypothetical protein CL943_00480 [Candidatus Diapherotrites archaeon]|uniref:Uncharacterized protein n=1 Tax=Candidatus Iainarchaeum sp. TaxID=3101447 RepID=A0A2D6M018_9ARCH|nr:hypothetical protein [Candidatus Diapherotrites archaeon]|tara:strand:+ start:2828 stop:3169 length:342 start_codon:yes stop_codon:yes gene_type:complete
MTPFRKGKKVPRRPQLGVKMSQMHLQKMTAAVQRFEGHLSMKLRGHTVEPQILKSTFEEVINGRERMLSPAQQHAAEVIRNTIKKPDVTIQEIQDILNGRTCIFKVHPDKIPR